MKYIFLFLLTFNLYAIDFAIHKYKIYWNGILVGYSQIGVIGKIKYKNEDCYILHAEAKNTKVLQYIYPVNNRAVSYWSIAKRVPLFSEKSLNEGRYHRYQRTVFEPSKKEIHWQQREFSGNVKNRENVWKNKQGTEQFLPDTQDILSAIFYLQLSPHQPEKNRKFSIPLFDDTRIVNLHIHILDLETVEITINNRKERKPAWKVIPAFETTGLFRTAGQMTLWIHREYPREILKMKVPVPYIGFVITELYEIEKL